MGLRPIGLRQIKTVDKRRSVLRIIVKTYYFESSNRSCQYVWEETTPDWVALVAWRKTDTQDWIRTDLAIGPSGRLTAKIEDVRRFANEVEEMSEAEAFVILL
jgi:hypothetical protein